MGNRVVIQFVSTDGAVSPVIYGHWHGSQAAETITALRAQMADRPDDISYVAARCIGRMCAASPDGSTGFGVWNADRELDANDSHGDAGVFIVRLGDVWRVEIHGGSVCEQGTVRSSANVKFKRIG